MKRGIVLLVVLLGLTAVYQSTFAQTGSSYDLSWSTIDGGGGRSSDAVYEVTGTVGQMDTGIVMGSGYELSGGFWQVQVTNPTAVTLHHLIAHPISQTFFLPFWLLLTITLVFHLKHRKRSRSRCRIVPPSKRSLTLE